MSQIKKLSAQHAPEVNVLVSQSFGYTPPHSFFDDFPVWDLRLHTKDDSNETLFSFGLFENEKLIAHVGARIAEMQTGHKNIKMGLIGAVATHADYRTKGHSTTLLKKVLEEIESAGCAWQLLWGSEHAFYKKLGFELQGDQARANLNLLKPQPQFITKSSNKIFTKPTQNDAVIKTGMTDLIFKSLLDKKSGIKLLETDRTWVFAHKTIKWFYIENPFAFIGFERGLDLGHIVHETGGDPESVRALLQHVHSLNSFAQIIAAPSELTKLGFKNENLILEKLCLARSSSGHKRWGQDFWVSGLGAC